MPTIAIILFCLLIVPLGKWVFENPHKAVPEWLWFGPDSQISKDAIRFVGVFWFFGGIWIALLVANSRLTNGFGEPLLSLGIAFTAAWRTFRGKIRSQSQSE